MNIQDELREAWDDAALPEEMDAAGVFSKGSQQMQYFAYGYLSAKRRNGGTRTDEGVLRDQFAGQALSGLLAQPSEQTPQWGLDEAAMKAYKYADAMLKARKGEQP